MKKTSWGKVSKKYNQNVGTEGHYFHKNVILPKVSNLLGIKNNNSLLDLACGQGVLASKIDPSIKYVGVDISPELINIAKRNYTSKRFYVKDITQNLNLQENNFDFCTIILALQNVKETSEVFKNAKNYLKPGGKFLIIMNHPVFRIPRQTSWGIDENSKQQYRKIYQYMSPLEIPINMTPGSGKATNTWSYHYPIQHYFNELAQNGFVIENLEEWVSDKTSVGKAARMENRSRNEIPMFMAIVAKKL